MDFSLIDYLNEDACYTKLLELLHPDRLACPRCGERHDLGIHRRHRAAVLDYECGSCQRVFNAWTVTCLQGIQWSLSQILIILRGIGQETPTAQMARDLGCNRRHLLALRHRLQEHARLGLDRNPLGDAVVGRESDEIRWDVIESASASE
jgi:transposase-like protein